MLKQTLLTLIVAVVLVGCGTDHPFDRGDDLPEGAIVDTPSGADLSFSADVKPLLAVCASCHSGGAGGWVYAGGVESYDAVSSEIDTITPQDSELLIKATGGDGHGGGAIFSASSSSYNTIVNWISQGAQNN